jgi:hypothetical protein
MYLLTPSSRLSDNNPHPKVLSRAVCHAGEHRFSPQDSGPSMDYKNTESLTRKSHRIRIRSADLYLGTFEVDISREWELHISIETSRSTWFHERKREIGIAGKSKTTVRIRRRRVIDESVGRLWFKFWSPESPVQSTLIPNVMHALSVFEPATKQAIEARWYLLLRERDKRLHGFLVTFLTYPTECLHKRWKLRMEKGGKEHTI